MIDREHALSVTKQAQAVGIARSTVYYLPRAVSPEDLALMKRIDKLHTELPFAGSRSAVPVACVISVWTTSP